MKRNLSLLLALTLFLGVFAACGTATAPSSTPKKEASPEIRSFTDSCGRAVDLPADIDKIAVSGPLAQLALFALAPEKLVGLSNEWDEGAEKYIAEKYYKLPVIGQLYGTKGELNLEELLSAAPDVVIDLGETRNNVSSDMDALQEQTGLPFVHISAATNTMGDTYRLLGQLLGMESQSETLAAYCDNTYAAALNLMDKVGAENKVSLVYCLGDTGTSVIASGSYHSEILDLMSQNAAIIEDPSSKGTGNQVDLEQLLIWNPAVIIFAPDSIYDSVGRDPTWRELDAVSNGRYYKIPYGPHNWMGFPPSVQRYLGLLWLGKLLYPAQADYDLYNKVCEFYSLFYHSDLSPAQYDELMSGAL